MIGPASTSACSAAAAKAITSSTPRSVPPGLETLPPTIPRSGIAGGELGYNAQSGNYLVGVEADGFWSGIKGNDNFALGSNDATSLRNGFKLRARGGIAVDRLLLFFTGGWAYGDFLHTDTDVANGLGVDQFTAHRSGLAAGGGIAYALTENLIGKVEYRYYDFGRFTRP